MVAKVGDVVDYKIEYKNIGTVAQNNVVIKDALPKGLSYLAGSTKIVNSENPSWTNFGSDKLTTDGIKIGNYAPGGNAFIKFSAKVTDASALDCGKNSLVNTAYANTENGSKKDSATVVVNKDCQETPKPKPATYSCDALAVNKLSDNRYSFEAGYKVDGGTFKNVTYIVRDNQGKEIAKLDGAPNKVEYTQNTAGKYSVQAIVTFMVDGKEVTASNDDCKKEFTVPAKPAPEKVEACELATKKIVTIDKSEYEANKPKYSTNLDDCKDKPVVEKEIEVCELATKTYPVKIKESAFDASKHSKNQADCKEVPTVPSKPVEKENCPIPGKEHLAKDSPECVENCTVPGKEHLPKESPECIVTATELPKTGGLDAAALVGLGAVTISLGYYLASRRNLA